MTLEIQVLAIVRLLDKVSVEMKRSYSQKMNSEINLKLRRVKEHVQQKCVRRDCDCSTAVKQFASMLFVQEIEKNDGS